MDVPKRVHIRWGKAGDTRVTYMEERFFPPDNEAEYIIAVEHAHVVAEKDARIADLEDAMRVIAETEWLEAEPGGNWKPEGSEGYIEEMEAFCNWALIFAKAALDHAALKGDKDGD